MTAQEYKSELIEKICFSILESQNLSYFNILNVCRKQNYNNPDHIFNILKHYR